MQALVRPQTSRTKGHYSRAFSLLSIVMLSIVASVSDAQTLTAREQLSILQASLPQLQRDGDWNAINKNLESISDLAQDREKLSLTQSLAALSQSADWHLAAIDQDKDHRIANHLLEYQGLQQQRLALAQSIHTDNNKAVAPYVYDEALAQVYIAMALVNTVGARDELMLRTEGITSTTGQSARISSRADFNSHFGSRSSEMIDLSYRRNMRSAIIALEELNASLLEEGDYESAAITKLFIGDLILVEHQFTPRTLTATRPLRGSPNIGRAMIHYREALELFTKAQVSPEQVSALLNCPVVVPTAQLELSLDALKPACPEVNNGGGSYIDLGSYYTLNSVAPGMNQSQLIEDDLVTAEVEFQIGANGQTSRREILSITPDDKRNRRLIDSVMENLQFRPAIIDEQAQISPTARLSIQVPAEA
ncbi:MAG: hypothetical protein R3332_10940 [Pseudohongiellaceae bacterium]|nr:hypothetical protein [Pseudohongiellaceae bacterium]